MKIFNGGKIGKFGAVVKRTPKFVWVEEETIAGYAPARRFAVNSLNGKEYIEVECFGGKVVYDL